ncbi:MAG: cation:proton antiporter [Bacteroidia bacterium]|nr:cation:proton antiporter [Bacteroidia bacterium]MCX7651713.1 cation:proton antiporter [Bacteroidia bacterium]MDW8417445.1 cation:proton antiporter [Bacteroidia bacterium]
MPVFIPELGVVGVLFIGLFLLSWLLQRWRIPALLGFMIAGFLIQSYPSRLMESFLPIAGEIAVWLLFFFVGLEYSPEHLKRLSKSIAKPGLIDFGINFGVVTLLGLCFSSPLESAILGGALYPSSTAIVARLLLDYGRLASAEAELLLGLLIFEDIVGVVLLGFLTPLTMEGTWSYVFILSIVGALLGVLFVFWGLYRWFVPWLARIAAPVGDEPLTVFLTLGLVLAIGAAGHGIGLSGALTSFLLGVLLPEGSELYKAAEKSLAPIRELSVGLFFLALSYSVEIAKLPLGRGIGWLLLALALKGISTFWAARVWGLQPRTALRAALSFLPKGEFSLLFGTLTEYWRSVILLSVIKSSILGTAAFAAAGNITRRLFPKR